MEPQSDNGVPQEAWIAADRAFNSPEWSPDRDELAEALAAASPHIRIDELDGLLRDLAVRIAQVPLLGRKNNVTREALEEVVQLVTERKHALEARPS